MTVHRTFVKPLSRYHRCEHVWARLSAVNLTKSGSTECKLSPPLWEWAKTSWCYLVVSMGTKVKLPAWGLGTNAVRTSESTYPNPCNKWSDFSGQLGRNRAARLFEVFLECIKTCYIFGWRLKLWCIPVADTWWIFKFKTSIDHTEQCAQPGIPVAHAYGCRNPETPICKVAPRSWHVEGHPQSEVCHERQRGSSGQKRRFPPPWRRLGLQR